MNTGPKGPRITIPKYQHVKAIEIADNLLAIDYTIPQRGWGYDFSVISINGDLITALGWGLGVEENDLILLGTKKGDKLYKVLSVEYMDDPRDMWKIRARWVPKDEWRTLCLLADPTYPHVYKELPQGEPLPTMMSEINNFLNTLGDEQ